MFLVHLLDAVLASLGLDSALQSRIIMILDVVVRSPGQMLGNLRPLVSIDTVELENLLVLFGGPLHLLDVRVEVIVPSV